MDISHHLRKNRTMSSKQTYWKAPEKKCLQCGIALQNDGSILYLQSFCSHLCKQRYMMVEL